MLGLPVRRPGTLRCRRGRARCCNAVFSYAAVQNTTYAPGTTYNHGDYSAGNLIWNPFGSSLNMGAEFLYGWQVRKDGSKGNTPRIQFSAKYNFVKLSPARK